MKTNFKYIGEGDSKDTILDSINANFDQILFSGIGYKGDDGPRGPKGLQGQIGKMGPIGITGDRSTKWFKQNEEPSGEIRDHDYWINTSPGVSGSDSIYLYDSGSWSYTGESFLTGSVLFKYSGILGPSGVVSNNAIIDSNYDLSYSSTFVLSDSVLDSSNVNLNYSKLKIINSISQDLPILGFCKLDYNDPLQPSFYWKSNDPDDLGISHKGSGSYQINSNKDIGFYAGLSSYALSEGDILISAGSINSNSTGTVEISSAGTGPNGLAMEINAQSLNISSLNLKASSDGIIFDRGLEIGATGDEGDRLYINAQTPTNSNSGAIEFNSYISDPASLTFTGSLTIDDFRLDDTQSNGQGPFRTDLVGITGGISGNIYLPYVKFGYPGVSGSYSTTGVYAVTTTYAGALKSVINLSSTSHYVKQGISVTTTNSSGPIDGDVYVKISQSLSNVSNSVYPTTYRFYYLGTRTYPGATLVRNRKFAGINYTTSNGSATTQQYLTFNQEVETFEITYDNINNLFYYSAIGSCGVRSFFSGAATSNGGLALS
jgi:hypothetical protein